MCGGVYYHFGKEDIRVYFPNPKATLPVMLKSGDVELLPWGRRKEQNGSLPLGGWARLESIYAGRWDKWFPRPVKLPICQFMEKDISGQSHWFDVMEGQYIQGLVASYQQERRIYVVTVTPEFEDAVHDRWPRLINSVK
ncbi:MAG: hypothetical protein V2I33_10970 [Kangiellaceae bacterium]|jgi:hypothetical protein|nr:hypothetical protein [Kangiellaceae bacterium]